MMLSVLTFKAQTIKPDEWQEHYDYMLPRSIVYANGKIYSLSDLSIYSFDIETGYKEKVGKVFGASDVKPQCAAYDEKTNTLVVGYESGCIDIFSGNSVVTEYALKNKNIVGSKAINAVECVDGYAIFATDYGISVYDIEKNEFRDSYFLGENYTSLKMIDIAVESDVVVAISDSTIIQFDIIDDQALSLENQRIIYHAIVDTVSFEKVEIFNGDVFVILRNDKERELYFWNNENGFELFKTQRGNYTSIKSKNEKLYVVSNDFVDIYDENHTLKGQISNEPYNAGFNDVAVDEKGEVWMSSPYVGLLHNGETLWAPTGTSKPYISDIQYMDGRIYCTQGFLWGYAPGMLFVYENGQWSYQEDYEFGHYMAIAVNPENSNEYYLSSFATGVVRYENGMPTDVYNNENAPFSAPLADWGEDVRISSSVRYDANGGLWTLNYWSDTVLYCFTPEGKWVSYSAGVGTKVTTYDKLFVDSRGYKWFSEESLTYAFSEEDTYEDKSDDLYKKVSMVGSDGEGFASYVLSIAEDREGDMWFGTENGIVRLLDVDHFFSGGATYDQIEITGEEFTETLLFGVRVTAIEVDGGNRKWLGTDGAGLFCVSPGGTKEIAHFTAENSPLPDNNISQLEINEQTGELFIGTGKGLISYRTDATEPAKSIDAVNVFPNPVRPEYEGNVYIEGLPEHASLKITDISGNLVQDALVNGGTAVWDLKNVYGNDVQSGIYLLFCTDEEGIETFVSKVAVVKGN